MYSRNFSTGRDSATFWDKGTEVHSLGTGRAGTACQQGMGRYEILTACPVPRDKMGQSRKGHSITGKGRSKTEKEVLKQERMF